MKILGLSLPRRLIYELDLLRELVVRDMKLRYKRSVLGIAWSLFNPLAQLLVLYFIFGLLFQFNIPHYSSFLFTGILAWNWFQSSLIQATGTIVDNRELIRRPAFPAAILPTVTVTSHLLHFLLAIPILMVFLMVDGIHLTFAILTLPIVIAIQYILILSLAFLIATLHVYFRDTQYLLSLFLQMLFYFTPVFYEASIVPARYRTLYDLNPMMHLIQAYRDILIKGELPDVQSLLVLSVVVVIFLSFSIIIFKRVSYHFVEEL